MQDIIDRHWRRPRGSTLYIIVRTAPFMAVQSGKTSVSQMKLSSTGLRRRIPTVLRQLDREVARGDKARRYGDGKEFGWLWMLFWNGHRVFASLRSSVILSETKDLREAISPERAAQTASLRGDRSPSASLRATTGFTLPWPWLTPQTISPLFSLFY